MNLQVTSGSTIIELSVVTEDGEPPEIVVTDPPTGPIASLNRRRRVFYLLVIFVVGMFSGYQLATIGFRVGRAAASPLASDFAPGVPLSGRSACSIEVPVGKLSTDPTTAQSGSHLPSASMGKNCHAE